jgi:CxxC motif-containing protein
VGVEGSLISRLPVKTRGEVPKTAIMEVIGEISRVTVKAPITRGQVVISNVAGTGVDVVATRNLIAV